MSLCWNFIPMSLSGNEIPTKWRGNEIPTNRPSELYIIYNPASSKGHKIKSSRIIIPLSDLGQLHFVDPI